MKLYGLALHTVQEIIEWYRTPEAAEVAVEQVLTDEPEFERIVGVEIHERSATSSYT